LHEKPNSIGAAIEHFQAGQVGFPGSRLLETRSVLRRNPGNQGSVRSVRQRADWLRQHCLYLSFHSELLASLDSLGSEARNQPLYVMIKDKLDDDNTQIDFDEFLDMMTQRVSTKDTRRDMHKIFAYFDEEKTGYISIKSLKKVVRELGENIDEAELQEMIDKADLDKDGLVSEEEFYAIMTKKEGRQQ
jgi:Ca2+-binding EF-hand superfamily protein